MLARGIVASSSLPYSIVTLRHEVFDVTCHLFCIVPCVARSPTAAACAMLGNSLDGKLSTRATDISPVMPMLAGGEPRANSRIQSIFERAGRAWVMRGRECTPSPYPPPDVCVPYTHVSSINRKTCPHLRMVTSKPCSCTMLLKVCSTSSVGSANSSDPGA